MALRTLQKGAAAPWLMSAHRIPPCVAITQTVLPVVFWNTSECQEY